MPTHRLFTLIGLLFVLLALGFVAIGMFIAALVTLGIVVIWGIGLVVAAKLR